MTMQCNRTADYNVTQYFEWQQGRLCS